MYSIAPGAYLFLGRNMLCRSRLAGQVAGPNGREEVRDEAPRSHARGHPSAHLARCRATRGDANAVLNTFGNGGWAVINHSDVARRGRVDQQIQIRPHPFFDGRHYCALDWHTIVVAMIEGGDRPFPRQQAAALIADISVQLTLDGAPLAISQTAVKRFLNPQRFGLEAAFYSRWGRVMQPSDLAVGEHELSMEASTSAGDFIQNTINFFIDADGTGACRQ
jgi:hypothetical protein